MDLFGGILWRYRLYVQPHLLMDENPFRAASRRYNNFIRRHADPPVCYIYADAGNTGDRMSATGLRFLAGVPGMELFAAPAGLAATSRSLKWLQEKRPDAKVLIGGGGLLQSCFSPFWTELLKTSLPFALFGIGANEMKDSRALPEEGLMRDIAHRSLAIHVRDKWTQELMQYGQKAQVSLGVCPSVNYLVSKFSGRQKTKTHLLHVLHPPDIRLAGGDAGRMSSVLKEAARKLGLHYDETDHIKEDMDHLAERYMRARAVVSSRLHGCIFSYAFGVPFVAVVCDKKVASFIETHAPGNPAASVKFGGDEILQAILAAESANGRLAAEKMRPLLMNNVRAMERVMGSFKNKNGQIQKTHRN